MPDKSPRFNGYEDRTAGVNDGDKSFVKESHRNDNTGAHEVGHGLGNSHVNSGLMKDEGASGGIGSNHIEEMLARAGIGDPSKIGGTAGNATLHIQGQGPVNFNSGRVMRQRRFDRWQTRLANREVRKQERATRRSQND